MPIIKPVPAEKTTPKSETTSKENGKSSVASFKQNPYYSPLYDCDVNYFRYAFSSDSLTIKSAVAIKSIDIKPLKKEDQKKTKLNKTAEVKLNETITTEKTNELSFGELLVMYRFVDNMDREKIKTIWYLTRGSKKQQEL